MPVKSIFDMYTPTPDARGEYSWSRDAKALEEQLGRDLTPEEYATVEEKVLAAAARDSLTHTDDEDDLDHIRELVRDIVNEHPDWDSTQIKRAVRRQVILQQAGGDDEGE